MNIRPFKSLVWSWNIVHIWKDDMVEENKELPGITFYLDGTQEQGTAGGKLSVLFTITAIADDPELLERVKKKFDGGFRVHTAEDFKGQMVRILREDVGEAERKVRSLETELRTEVSRREAAERELAEYKNSFDWLNNTRKP